MQELLNDAANPPGRLRFADGHALHPVIGIWNRIPAPKKAQALSLRALATTSSAMLLLAVLAALLGCGLASPVLATPLPDGTSVDEGPVEDTNSTLVDCSAHTATLLQVIAVLQRSLSKCADSFAASEVKSEALAGKLLESERTARMLQRDNAALRGRLDAAPTLGEMPEPTTASSQTRSSSRHTSQLSPHAGRNAYPATLPVSGAQTFWPLAWVPAELACTHGRRMHEWGSSAGFLQLQRCVRLHRVPSRPRVPRSACEHEDETHVGLPRLHSCFRSMSCRLPNG
jgi:hypothetical protein